MWGSLHSVQLPKKSSEKTTVYDTQITMVYDTYKRRKNYGLTMVYLVSLTIVFMGFMNQIPDTLW